MRSSQAAWTEYVRKGGAVLGTTDISDRGRPRRRKRTRHNVALLAYTSACSLREKNNGHRGQGNTRGQTPEEAARSALKLLLTNEYEGVNGALFLKIRKFKQIVPHATVLQTSRPENDFGN
jgi:hypothetical protein